MGQQIESVHFSEAGVPAGGTTTGIGIGIRWQKGPLGRGPDRKEQNGAFVEDVIQVAIDRLKYFQASQFACDENAVAISLLTDAIVVLDCRTVDRERRGVEGTHEI